MIELVALVAKKPEKIGNVTRYGMEEKKIPVTKIMCCNSSHHYVCLVHEPNINAPFDRAYPDGQVWVSFYKKHNKDIKLPVLKKNEAREV
ncbi:hypothetical protein [Methylovulum psychrotolerans]|uniref:Uncharacterized protein n=1 Tax=Methylovulum psychrotolerans TaxID=1704499 RepID=A0A2S5CGE2_9GAMM|nr:hypothetical protein [Methylovulum psychrotolerans]POZ49878.1 hypothetical protein AADEFJLK_04324 [Methylovulum psychrotolerans]